MKKSDLLANVLIILKNHKIKNEDLILELTELIGPKTGGNNRDEFPNILDEDGNIKEKYCCKMGIYLDIENFPKSTKSKDGYDGCSKLGLKIQSHYSKMIKNVEDEIKSKMDNFMEFCDDEKNENYISLDNLKIFKEDKTKEIEDIKKERLNLPYSMDLYNSLFAE